MEHPHIGLTIQCVAVAVFTVLYVVRLATNGKPKFRYLHYWKVTQLLHMLMPVICLSTLYFGFQPLSQSLNAATSSGVVAIWGLATLHAMTFSLTALIRGCARLILAIHKN